MEQTKIYLFALPVFVAAMFGEALYFRFVLKKEYGWRAVAPNLAMALGYLATHGLTNGIIVASYFLAYEFRIFTIPMDHWSVWVALVFVVDFAYYWQHRLSHEIRWFWAMHNVHHSAQQISFSVAYRLGWTYLASGMWLALAPICFLGFDPWAMLIVHASNQLYQFWLHTETIPKLGFLEAFLCTPSHHRVHHATNPEYLDRNYAGIFIFWDKMFGTFAEEKEGVPRVYGLVRQIHTNNPVKIALAEWIPMLRDLFRARNVREVVGYLFGPPGWKPDGKGMTTAVIRARAEEQPAIF